MQATLKSVTVNQNDVDHVTAGNVYNCVECVAGTWIIDDNNRLYTSPIDFRNTTYWQIIAVNGVPVSG